jgi:hypothetical protein
VVEVRASYNWCNDLSRHTCMNSRDRSEHHAARLGCGQDLFTDYADRCNLMTIVIQNVRVSGSKWKAGVLKVSMTHT